jgi:hypothetical protein
LWERILWRPLYALIRLLAKIERSPFRHPIKPDPSTPPSIVVTE